MSSISSQEVPRARPVYFRWWPTPQYPWPFPVPSWHLWQWWLVQGCWGPVRWPTRGRLTTRSDRWWLWLSCCSLFKYQGKISKPIWGHAGLRLLWRSSVFGKKGRKRGEWGEWEVRVRGWWERRLVMACYSCKSRQLLRGNKIDPFVFSISPKSRWFLSTISHGYARFFTSLSILKIINR